MHLADAAATTQLVDDDSRSRVYNTRNSCKETNLEFQPSTTRQVKSSLQYRSASSTNSHSNKRLLNGQLLNKTAHLSHASTQNYVTRSNSRSRLENPHQLSAPQHSMSSEPSHQLHSPHVSQHPHPQQVATSSQLLMNTSDSMQAQESPTDPTSFLDKMAFSNENQSGLAGADTQNPSTSFNLPSLFDQFPSEDACRGVSLRIVRQPEMQHRARYMTEGSRGTVKDRTGDSFPSVQLNGWNGPALLQVFVGSENGPAQPHIFYQACYVASKSVQYYKEAYQDGTKLLQLDFNASSSSNSTVLCVDCLGILKLRNADVEQRSLSFSRRSTANNPSASANSAVQSSTGATSNTQTAASTHSSGSSSAGSPRTRSNSARIIFRVCLPRLNRMGVDCLQIATQPINCTQVIGNPEICRISLSECPMRGGRDLFIVGKNFTRTSRVILRQYQSFETMQGGEQLNLLKSSNSGSQSDSGAQGSSSTNAFSKLNADPLSCTQIVWEREANLEKEYIHQSHLICHLPAYDGTAYQIGQPIVLYLFVECHPRISDAKKILYLTNDEKCLQSQANMMMNADSLIVDECKPSIPNSAELLSVSNPNLASIVAAQVNSSNNAHSVTNPTNNAASNTTSSNNNEDAYNSDSNGAGDFDAFSLTASNRASNGVYCSSGNLYASNAMDVHPSSMLECSQEDTRARQFALLRKSWKRFDEHSLN